ncbi:hypothetical protein C8F04DRAFT_1173369 [Mycena alexandri]|uniref:Uncharacterized protein n=1 Tax=Mycena alexandri TaxID=1745969 RepID=A0AAD6XBM8_9AGAR|nr:hypothetical protein C8F04DRAFT_1173369 [Mycena alexandri]
MHDRAHTSGKAPVCRHLIMPMSMLWPGTIENLDPFSFLPEGADGDYAMTETLAEDGELATNLERRSSFPKTEDFEAPRWTQKEQEGKHYTETQAGDGELTLLGRGYERGRLLKRAPTVIFGKLNCRAARTETQTEDSELATSARRRFQAHIGNRRLCPRTEAVHNSTGVTKDN